MPAVITITTSTLTFTQILLLLLLLLRERMLRTSLYLLVHRVALQRGTCDTPLSGESLAATSLST
jgi:hypothetical protein